MELKRFLITEKSGQYIAAVYAERFVEHNQMPPGGNFWIGNVIVGSADLEPYIVGDSGGLMTIDPASFTDPKNGDL